MKAIKILLLVVLLLVVLVVGSVVGLLSSAGLQTSLVRRHAPEGVRIERIHLGFRGLSIDSAHVEHEGVIVRLDGVRVMFPLIRTLLRRELHIAEFVIAGLNIDATDYITDDVQEIPPTPPRDPVTVERVRDLYDEEAVAEIERVVEAIPFDGLFREELIWPPLRIDLLVIDALVRLPKGVQTLEFEIIGSDIGGAENSTVRLSLFYNDFADDAVLSQGSVNVESGWRLSDSGHIIASSAAIESSLQLHHEGELIALQAALLLQANQRADSAGEDYLLTLDLGPDASARPTVFKMEAGYDYDTEQIGGDWTLDFASHNLADLTKHYLKGATLVLASAGQFAMQAQTGTASLQGQIELDGHGLDRVLEELAVLPNVSLQSKFDVAGDTHQARINEFHIELAGGDHALLHVRTDQAFGIDLANLGPVDVDPNHPLLRIHLENLPSELVDAFVSDINLAWSGVTGDLLVTAVDDEFVLETAQPVTLLNLTASMAEEKLVESINLEIPLHAVLGGDQVQLEISPLRISSEREIGILTLATTLTELTAEQPHFVIAADWQINLPVLLAQPVAEAFRNVQEGQLKGEVKARGTAAALEGQLQSTFSNLVVSDGRAVDEVSIASDFVIQEGGVISLTMPIRSTLGNQLSQLDLATKLRLGDPLAVTLAGEGETLWVDHFLVLADAFQNSEFVPPEDPSIDSEQVDRDEDSRVAEPMDTETDADVPAPPADVPIAPWAGIRAELDLTLGEVRVEGQPPIYDVVLQGRIGEEGILFEPVRARIEDSPISATAELLFDPETREQLYQLVAELNVSRFDVGGYLRAAQPEATPPIEALVTADIRVRSAAAELEQLADQAIGQIQVTASEAIVRAFRQGRVSRAADAAAAAGRIGGLISGRDDVDAVGELARYFNEIHFDELTLNAERNPDLSVDISRLALRNAELQMIGTGVVSHVEGREFHQQPIALTFDVGVRSPLDRLFDRLRLLEEEAADDGYRRVNRPLRIEGNFGEPDPRPFWAILIDAAARRALPDRRPSEERDGEPEREPRSPLDRLQRYL